MQNKLEIPNYEIDGWNIREIAEQATNEFPDEILRKILRQDADKEAGDALDNAGSVESSETPQGSEENKIVEGATK